jgi:hypothetical protein
MLPTQCLLTKFGLTDIKFIELLGSGAGDQYIFQGFFDLGNGFRHYNLAIYICDTSSEINIMCIEGHWRSEASQSEFEAGLVLGRKLAATLPGQKYTGMKYPTSRMRKAWKSAKRYR